jgi:hypothetical protein
VAKNIMTVGAVNDAVSGSSRSVANGTMAAFSGWGPTDDGRIKPDIVANGTGLYSCHDDSDSAYTSIGGTSMSTPNAAGSAALLADYYSSLYPGQAMLSSTLKGLILHTADDPPASNPGPDYAFGWGLMNTYAAAEHIRLDNNYSSARYISAGTLNSGTPSHSFTFSWNGSDPIRATLCWTDPPGSGQSGLDDTTLMLVNDLDLRIYGPGGAPVYYPWILDPANPANNAATGDNIRDNVEQVYIASPPAAGLYTLEITHKGSLTDGEQEWSLILSGQRSDPMDVTPEADFDSAGPMGGPFTPASAGYTITNTGGATLSWSASVTQPWIDLSATSGNIPAGGSAPLTVSINSNAEALAAGSYLDTLTITNVSTGGSRPVSICIEVRPVDTFDWGVIGSPQVKDQPFNVTLTARDSAGLTVSAFGGPVNLTGLITATNAIGAAAGNWTFPLYTWYHDARTQVIYLAGELGAAGTLASLALDVTTLPGQPLNNWTIRMKHTALSTYASAAWESTGWTTVYQNNETIAATGWTVFTFDTPFYYNGSDNLMIDFSFNNTSYTGSGASAYSVPGGTRSIYAYSDSGAGDPLTWSGTSPSPNTSSNVPDIRLVGEDTVNISPATTGGFSGGVWSGSVAVLEEAAGMLLRADDGGGHQGDSNSFDVVTAPAVVNVTSTHAGGAFGAGEAFILQAQFSEAVTVSGSPELTLNTGTPNGVAAYSGGSGSSILEFSYTAAAPDESADLDYTAVNALDLNGGTIIDTATGLVNAILTLAAPGTPGSLGANRDIVIDTEAPAAACTDITVNLSSPVVNAAAIDGGSTDNFGIAQYLIDGNAARTFTCADALAGPVSAVLTVSDAAGNQHTCTAAVTLIDDIGPSAVCTDITVNLSSPTITPADIDAGSTAHCGPISLLVDGAADKTFSCADAGNSPISVELRATDALGQTDTCAAQVTVIDDIGPAAVCTDITVNLSSPTITPADIDAGSTAHCGPMSLLVDGAADKTFSCADAVNSPISVELRVTDALGASETCTAQVTVIDDIGPAAVCTDIAVNLSSPTITPADIDAGSTAHCGPMTLLVDGAADKTFSCADAVNSPISVELRATDALGASETCAAQVTVIDDIGPSAVCRDITVNLSLPLIRPWDIDDGSSVHCGPMTMLVEGASQKTFTCADVADSPVDVELRVTDANGQTDTCTALVTVLDDTGPSAVCRDITVNLSSPTITVLDIDDGSNVYCGPMTLLVDGAAERTFTCADAENNSPVDVELRVSDAIGQTAACTAQVTVIDDVAPAAACRDLTVVVDGSTGMAEIDPLLLDDGSADTCSLVWFSAEPAEIPVENAGLNTVTLVVHDIAGNTASCTSQVRVEPPLSVIFSGAADEPGGNAATVIRGSRYELAVTVSGDIAGELHVAWKYREAGGAWQDVGVHASACIQNDKDACPAQKDSYTFALDPVEYTHGGEWKCVAWDDLNSAESEPVILVVATGIPALAYGGLALLSALLAAAGCRRVLRRQARQ